jgi:hypothetical protein
LLISDLYKIKIKATIYKLCRDGDEFYIVTLEDETGKYRPTAACHQQTFMIYQYIKLECT